MSNFRKHPLRDFVVIGALVLGAVALSDRMADHFNTLADKLESGAQRPVAAALAGRVDCADPQFVSAVKETLLKYGVPLPLPGGYQMPLLATFLTSSGDELKEYGQKLDVVIKSTPELNALSYDDQMKWVAAQFDELYKKRMDGENFTNVETETRTDSLLVCHLQWVGMRWPARMASRPTPFDGFIGVAREKMSHIDYEVQLFDDREHFRVTVSGPLVTGLKSLYK